MTKTTPPKRPLHQKALDAYLRGELRPLGWTPVLRSESDYEQDLAKAERLMSAKKPSLP